MKQSKFDEFAIKVDKLAEEYGIYGGWDHDHTYGYIYFQTEVAEIAYKESNEEEGFEIEYLEDN
jgi:hypothetical protein